MGFIFLINISMRYTVTITVKDDAHSSYTKEVEINADGSHEVTSVMDSLVSSAWDLNTYVLG